MNIHDHDEASKKAPLDLLGVDESIDKISKSLYQMLLELGPVDALKAVGLAFSLLGHDMLVQEQVEKAGVTEPNQAIVDAAVKRELAMGAEPMKKFLQAFSECHKEGLGCGSELMGLGGALVYLAVQEDCAEKSAAAQQIDFP